MKYSKEDFQRAVIDASIRMIVYLAVIAMLMFSIGVIKGA